jgi:hypothetical protein
MATVCKNCFSDRELVGFIISQAKINDCTFCRSKNIECILVDELYDFFLELLGNFKKDITGQPLKSVLQSNWSLFSSLKSAYDILNYVTYHTKSSISNADEKVSFSDDILDNVNYWEILKKQLFEKTRYLTDTNYLIYDLGWDSFFSSQIKLEKGKELFRARLHQNSSEPPFNSSQMFCPPKDKATAGRANPAGIPFLYLSDNQQTVLYEIRAAYLDEISIGTFVLDNKITTDIFISDFTEIPTIFHPSKVSDKIKSSLLKEKISFELSKPLRRYDSEIEYIPTQFICEFIKIYTGVHGIKFRSSLHTIGNNMVIFDQTIMQCIKIEKVKVNRVEISAA